MYNMLTLMNLMASQRSSLLAEIKRSWSRTRYRNLKMLLMMGKLNDNKGAERAFPTGNPLGSKAPPLRSHCSVTVL